MALINFLINIIKKIFFLINSITHKIFHRTIFKSKINIVIRKKNGNVLKKAGKQFSRNGYNFDPKYLIEREKIFLQILDGIISPKLKDFGKGWIEMEYCGEPISKKNLPSDWEYQIKQISSVLSKFEIIHRDIKAANILVNNGKIVLIDFSWSVFKSENYYISPREFTNINEELIYDNYYALRFFINSLK